MRQAWRKVLLVLVCCVLAVAGWIGLLNLAEVISAARSYRASPAELRAAADAAVLPAADPASSDSGEYTDADKEKDKFVDGNIVCTRYAETNIATRELAAFNIPMEEYMDASQLYAYPAVFRYVKTDTYSAGTFIEMDYVWSSYYASTAVPQGWLLALPYLRDNAHVRLIVPSKMGHTSAQQYVTPYFYDITEFRKARS